ncbi:hypothetical protein [Acinetobacter baumannii]|uniref:hypothetical protein n=1 Tax=Acinetobacter baumannii TaxID=470 RepID=UPI0002BC10E1|nr:hypothetical protein [Acinetobacter baumannii]EGY5283233.1 hypothetical protein [Acinetobacter baumannii]EKT8144443.1 hypothetical protein [Acinetobacter baumannii]EKU7086488.1 hypothetical protein [Acinetobacter baumannii]EKV1043129.1 hypothetical protein [Acinetobacter baumannii]EKV1046583.1 hypothetical protein [Acinetobacter baumannii]
MSKNELPIEFLKQAVEIQIRTIFMLITATTASLAYILNQIRDSNWDEILYFPLASIISLSISFFLGFSCLKYKAELAADNGNYHEINDYLTNTERKERIAGLKKLLKRTNTLFNFQSIFFFIGLSIYAFYIFFNIYVKSISL